MENVPFHDEVLRFAKDIAAGLDGEYELACEHAHSCCTVLAHTRFKLPVRPEHLPLGRGTLGEQGKAGVPTYYYDEPADGPEAAATRWHTWIDYKRFHQLVAGKMPFTALDCECPYWLVCSWLSCAAQSCSQKAPVICMLCFHMQTRCGTDAPMGDLWA
eukprot:SAG31_NODE_595_length_13695_cov_11.446896_2_plen_159_part_00